MFQVEIRCTSRFSTLIASPTAYSKLQQNIVRCAYFTLRHAARQRRYKPQHFMTTPGSVIVPILLADNESMRQLNSVYLHRKKKQKSQTTATDALAFCEEEFASQFNLIGDGGVDDLGTIALCPNYILKKQQKMGPHYVSYGNRLEAVLIHAILHLFGYTHEVDSDYHEMVKMEKRIFRAYQQAKRRKRKV
eukprot:PhF_6_TR31755/c0_g1_i1/m.46749/K07042/ybeY, yqfG; probable rRNA maturation factor